MKSSLLLLEVNQSFILQVLEKVEGINIHDILKDNDAYTALKAVNGLIITGATGTNVNDVAIALIDN